MQTINANIGYDITYIVYRETSFCMADNKLKIRIQLQQSSIEADESYEETPPSMSDSQQPLDWKKISIAATLTAILLGFMMYLLLSSDKSVFNPEQDTIPLTEQIPTSQENQFAISNLLDYPVDTPMAVAPESNSSIKDNNNDSDASIALPKTDPTATPIRIKPKSATTTKKGVILPARKPEPPNKTSTSVLEPGNIEASINAQVLRAQLTHAIKHREPVDSIESITLNNGESKYVYFYLHLTNLQDKAIHIVWYHNDKVDSKLILQVHSNNWRTYASKYMNQRRLGAWHVELMDDSGNILAVKNFTVLQS